MLETVRNEAAELRNFTITFLSLLLYISLIVAATDHEQILRVSPVTLPLLNVNIPILGFYWFMPPFLFCMHLYILVQHYLFSLHAFSFEAALRQETPEMQRNIRRRLGNLPFLHSLLGRHEPMMRGIMTFISVISLVIWPVFMFWWMQARFRPYHDEDLVLWQQGWLTVDTFLLAYLWAKTLDNSDSAGRWWKKMGALWAGILRICATDWRYTKTHLRYWRSDVSVNRITPNPWRRRLCYLTSWWRSGMCLYNNNKQRFKRYYASLGLMMTGLARIAFTLLLLLAWIFSWSVSLVPDSAQEKNLIKRLAWIEALTEFDSINTAEKSESDESNAHENHWLLENVNSSYISTAGIFIMTTGERLLFWPTARLHETRMIDDKTHLEQYDPARVSE